MVLLKNWIWNLKLWLLFSPAECLSADRNISWWVIRYLKAKVSSGIHRCVCATFLPQAWKIATKILMTTRFLKASILKKWMRGDFLPPFLLVIWPWIGLVFISADKRSRWI